MKFNKIILAVLSLSFFCSCETETVIGPDIEGIGSIPEPISNLESSRDTVDFTNNELIYFNLEFEEPTNWLLTLTGQVSGAKFTFENVSDAIDESNSNWEGLTEGVFFQAESVIAEVSFPNYLEEPTLLDTFVIAGIESSKTQGVLYTDFSDISDRIYNFGTPEPAGGGWGTDFPVTVNTNMEFPLFDGNPYLYFEGAPWQENSPFVDILIMPSNLGDTLSDEFLPLFSAPERVYLNLAVYNTGTEDTWLSVQLKEQSVDGPTRSIDIRPDWVGWKLISVRYSDLLSEDTSIYDPQSVAAINLVLLSDQAESDITKEIVSVAIDQVTFSFDSPLGTTSF